MEQGNYTQLLADFLGLFGWFSSAVTVDRVGLVPGSAGLFPAGQEEKLLRRDILEQSLYQCTWHYTLRCRAVAGKETAARLEAFAQWLRERSRQKNCPQFGADTCITAGKWKLSKHPTGGCDLYEIGLTVTATVSR